MKKIYLLLSAAVVSTASFAQYRSASMPASVSMKNLTVNTIKTTNDKAVGDSLMYFNSQNFFLADAADNTDFALANQDFDGGTPAASATWPTDFIFSFVDSDANETPYTGVGPNGAGNFFPNDLTAGVDSAWYIGAASWFTETPPPTANNWWNFGPITIPATTTSGNTFNFFDKHNPQWTDSYDVYIVNMTNVTDPQNPDGLVDVIANGLTPDFSKAQISSAPNGPDTTWTLHTINVDAFIGQRIFVYFNHDAADGDLLLLDEMWVEEGISTGIEELNNVNFNVFPNPSKGEFNINLTANQADNVSMIVRDVVGKTIVDRTLAISGQRNETISLTDYSKGIYFLTIDNKTVKLIVE